MLREATHEQVPVDAGSLLIIRALIDDEFKEQPQDTVGSHLYVFCSIVVTYNDKKKRKIVCLCEMKKK
jgi:hypothetical protein